MKQKFQKLWSSTRTYENRKSSVLRFQELKTDNPTSKAQIFESFYAENSLGYDIMLKTAFIRSR